MLKYVPDDYTSQEMCVRAAEKDMWLYAFKFVPGQYVTQEICETAFDNNQKLLKFVSDLFFTRKMLENLLY